MASRTISSQPVLRLLYDIPMATLYPFGFSISINTSTLFLYFTYVKNSGAAWSILSNNTWLLLLVGIICLIGLNFHIYQKKEFELLEVIYFGLIIGGIMGNLIDRIFYGGVIDFIGMIFGNYYFPIFNIADICIVSGMLLLMIDSLGSEKNEIRSDSK